MLGRIMLKHMTKEQLKRLREDMKLTQEELGKALGRTRQTVINWEMGHCPISIVTERAIKAMHAAEREAR